MSHREDLFVGGRWTPAGGGDLIAVIDPSTEECIATVREACEADVDEAVAAAISARRELAALAPEERSGLLDRWADALERRTAELVSTISGEMGMPAHLTADYQVASAIAVLRTTAKALATIEFEQRVGHSLVRRGPVGVVAAITPWNYPLLQTTSKVGPALAAGCPVVLKPSEIAPLDAYLLAEAAQEAGLPPGSVNVVVGTGPHVGEALVRHPGVDMVSLTGSTRAGYRVGQLAAAGVKRVALELGGKSPAVLLPDADMDRAVADAVHSVMVNSGQTCTALTRLVVPLQLQAEVEELVAGRMSGYLVGPAADPTSDLGPLAYASQVQRVEEMLERAALDGSRQIWGYDREQLPGTGYFVAPAAYVVTDRDTSLAQDEIFGPVIIVQPYLDERDAVDLANCTKYGLAATVWSSDPEHALRIASQIDSGTIDINGAPFNPGAPFGGFKQSGHGRELGTYGIEEFTELKAIQLADEGA